MDRRRLTAGETRRPARHTYRTILQNLGWAFGYNTAAIPLARLVTSGGCPRLARHRWGQRFTGWGCDHCPFGRKIKDLSMPNGQW